MDSNAGIHRRSTYSYTHVIILILFMVLTPTPSFSSQVSALHVVRQSSYSLSSIPYRIQYIPSPGAAINAAQYVLRNVSIPAATVGGFAKNAMGGPVGLALTAAFLAAGYLWDDASQEFSPANGAQPYSFTNGHECWSDDNNTHVKVGLAQTEQECLSPIVASLLVTSPNSGYWWNTSTCVWYAPSHSLRCNLYLGNPGTNAGVFNAGHSVAYTGTQTFTPASAVPLTDSEVGYLFETNYLNDYLPDVLSDASGLPEVYPELQTALDDVQADFDAQYDADPLTVPDSNTSTGDTALDTQQDELFGCQLLPVVCDIYDWLTEEPSLPANVDLPIEEIDPYTGYSSGLGNGQCPASRVATFMGENIIFSFQTACDLMGWIRPLILAAAYLSAGYILIGIRS